MILFAFCARDGRVNVVQNWVFFVWNNVYITMYITMYIKPHRWFRNSAPRSVTSNPWRIHGSRHGIFIYQWMVAFFMGQIWVYQSPVTMEKRKKIHILRGLGCPSPPKMHRSIWVFPKIGVPQNGWFIMEIPIQMDDLGVPLFSETLI